MKVFNLTDVRTEVLEQRQLLGMHFAVGTRMIAPGEFAEVEDTADNRTGLEYLLIVGALAIDNLPPPYLEARRISDTSKGRARLAHVNVPETRVADDPPVSAQPVEGVVQVVERAPTEPAPDEAVGKSEDLTVRPAETPKRGRSK